MAKRIMTVEDSNSLREMVVLVLRDAGYVVSEAADGREAFAKLKTSGVDLVVTDLNMPNMDGIESTRALRDTKMYKFTPIVFLTTESQIEKKEAAKAAGATGWIVKPFKPEKLLKVIKKVLG